MSFVQLCKTAELESIVYRKNAVLTSSACDHGLAGVRILRKNKVCHFCLSCNARLATYGGNDDILLCQCRITKYKPMCSFNLC